MVTNIIPNPSPVSSIFSVLTALQGTNPNAVAAIVRPNNPPAGIAGFVFDIQGEEHTELSSRITDSYIEDNTAIADQWSLEPERVTVRGYMAELVTASPETAALQSVPDPMPLNGPMVPTLTPQAAPSSATPSADNLYDYYEQQSVISNLSGPLSGTQAPQKQTRQSDAFLFFYALWTGRQLCSVETPYGIWTDMAIERLRAEQPEETIYYSSFLITFKKMRFAQDITVNVGQLAGRAVAQQSPVVQNGNAGQTNVPVAQATANVSSWLNQSFGP